MKYQSFEKGDKAQLLAEAKRTHEWLQEGYYDRLRGTYHPQVGCCKKCGIHYQLFKFNPKKCPASEDKS